MKLLKGGARAFSAILWISVFVLFSSNLSVAKDTNLDPLPGQQDENFAQESVSDADPNPRGISDKHLEENAGKAPGALHHILTSVQKQGSYLNDVIEV